MRTDRRSVSLVAALLVVGVAAAARADLAVVPTGYATIQAAIDAVQGTPGATVRIDSNAVFDEFLLVESSVAIVAGAAGGGLAMPVLRGAISYYVPAGARETLTLFGLVLRPWELAYPGARVVNINPASGGYAEANVIQCWILDPDAAAPTALSMGLSGGEFDVTVVGTTIALGGSASDEPVGIEVAGSGRLVVSGSSIAIDGDGAAVSARSLGALDVRVESSTIRLGSSSPAVPTGVQMLGGGDLTITSSRFELDSSDDVIPQAVSLRTDAPAVVTIDANAFEDVGAARSTAISASPFASLVMTMTNNLVQDVGRGIFTNPQPAAGLWAVLVNNTFDGARDDAVAFSGFGSVVAFAINNLFTRNGGAALASYASQLDLFEVFHDYDGYFGNIGGDFDGPFAPDPHGFFGSPEYESGTLRPASDSPVRNIGLDTAPGLGAVDVAGNPRIEGPAIDLGAYEVPEPGAVACACAALAALSRLVRRRRVDRAALVAVAGMAASAAHAATAVVPVPYATIQSAVNAVQGTSDALVRIDSSAVFAEHLFANESVAIVAGTIGGLAAHPRIEGDVRFAPDADTRRTLRLEGIAIQVAPGAAPDSALLRVDASGAGVAELDLVDSFLIDLEGVGVDGVVIDDAAEADVEIEGTSIWVGGSTPVGTIGVRVDAPGRVAIRDSAFTVAANGTAIRALASPLDLVVERNTFAIDGSVSFSWAIDVIDASRTTIARNVFELSSSGDAGASGVDLRPVAPLRAAIDANLFDAAPDADSVAIYCEPRASLQLTVTNNVVSGGLGGVTLAPHAGMDALLVHNTIDSVRGRAIELAELGGTLAAGIFGNLLTNAGLHAIYQGGSPAAFLVVNDYNGYDGNLVDFDTEITPDPHGWFGPPGYLPGTLQPASSAPVVDRGLASTPGLPLFDVAGNERIAGDAPDLGAYEVPEPKATLGACAALLALGASIRSTKLEARSQRNRPPFPP